jgi:sulfate adenylyltransferase subunit 1 (EFTu-like GTPase family)
MDLVEFDEATFDAIRNEFCLLLNGPTLHSIPISALDGDNVIVRSDRTPWFDGQPLLEYLETVDVETSRTGEPFRFPVQLVMRPDHDFRGYAGQVASGTVRPGDTVTVWPSGLSTRVKSIVTWDGELPLASAPMSVVLTLEDDIDISRGDVLATGPVHVSDRFSAHVVWMDERPLDPGRVYLVKHAARTTSVEVDARLALNEIGRVIVTASRPLVFDAYDRNRTTGSFVLIDPSTNATAGAGMIARAIDEPRVSTRTAAADRLALAARAATTDAEAIAVVQRMLEEILA